MVLLPDRFLFTNERSLIGPSGKNLVMRTLTKVHVPHFLSRCAAPDTSYGLEI